MQIWYTLILAISASIVGVMRHISEVSGDRTLVAGFDALPQAFAMLRTEGGGANYDGADGAAAKAAAPFGGAGGAGGATTVSGVDGDEEKDGERPSELCLEAMRDDEWFALLWNKVRERATRRARRACARLA